MKATDDYPVREYKTESVCLLLNVVRLKHPHQGFLMFSVSQCIAVTHLLFCHSGCCVGSWVPEHLGPFSLWHLWRFWKILSRSWCYRYSHPSQILLYRLYLVRVCVGRSCTSSAPPGCRLEWARRLLLLRRWHRRMLLHGCLRVKAEKPNEKQRLDGGRG